jgi:hypothetical protein
MRMLFWPVFILLTFVNEATAGDVATPKIEHLEGGYSVELPASLSIAPGNPMPDFVLYKVNDPAGKQLLAIYLGCAPDTRFKPPANAVSSSTPIGGYAATSLRWSDKGEGHSGTSLLQLKSNGWPCVAHMIFRDLSKGDAELAESIVRSFSADESPK